MKSSTDKKDIYNADILHLGYYINNKHSIRKCIDNIITNCPEFRHHVFSLEPNASGPRSAMAAIQLVNQLKPEFLHLHFSSSFDPKNFAYLEHRPIIVNTIHGEVRNPYRDYVDVLVCIHQACFDVNIGRRLIIEGTPFISNREQMIRNTFQRKGVFLNTRFSDDCLSEDTIKLYGRIKQDVFIYGYLGTPNARRLKLLCNREENIKIMPWCDDIEVHMAEYQLFAYFPPQHHSGRSYDFKVMEAALLGLPIVTTPRQSQQHYVLDGVNGFLVSSHEDFVEKCNLLLTDTTLYDKFKRRAMEHSATLRNTMPDEYRTLYQKLISEKVLS